MLHSRLGRVVASAVLAGAAVAALSGGPAFAAKPGIACSVLSGSISGKVAFKGCTGNTGGASKPMAAAALTSGGTIKWKNAKSTTVTLKIKAGDQTRCAAGSSEYDASGKTTADTTGSAVIGGKVKASVCVNGDGGISLVAGTKATIQ